MVALDGKGESDARQRPIAATWRRWRLGPNRWSASESAGAFGDLGILVPFVVGYLVVLRLDPTGVLLGFGVSMILAGLFYRTPVPVQPMKAIGATAIAGGATVSAGMLSLATLLTGAIWLLLGVTGAIRWVTAVVSKPVVRGVVLGLLFRDSVGTIFRLFPRGVLGVLVAFAGLELATSARELGTKEEATTTLLTAGFAAFHMGVALVAGVALHFAFQRRWVRL